MHTTIDRAGRLVVPKQIRDRLHIGAGAEVEIEERDGVIEIRPVVVTPRVVATPAGPVVETDAPLPALTDEIVRDTIDQVRR
jgi:AbrB family looped-hinge helix DNA binding protein